MFFLSFFSEARALESPSFLRASVGWVTLSTGWKSTSLWPHIRVLKSPNHQGPISQPHFWEENGIQFYCPCLPWPFSFFFLKESGTFSSVNASDKRPHPFLHKYAKVLLHVWSSFPEKDGFFPFVFVSVFRDLAGARGRGSPRSFRAMSQCCLGFTKGPTTGKGLMSGHHTPKSIKIKKWT